MRLENGGGMGKDSVWIKFNASGKYVLQEKGHMLVAARLQAL